METLLLVVALLAGLCLVAWLFVRRNLRGKPAEPLLQAGKPLPEFSAEDEKGQPVSSRDLLGRKAVLLFIRGNWCPFCTRQVEELAKHYQRINELGAKLVFVTPKPLETTRRVGDIYKVEFDFWLDAGLAAARQLGLVHQGGVPGKHHATHGTDTIWPTAIVVAPDGVISYLWQSKRIVDRPDPADLVEELEQLD